MNCWQNIQLAAKHLHKHLKNRENGAPNGKNVAKS